MFTGRSLHESFRPAAGPAMTAFRNSLILAWSAVDGFMYSAMDMQDDGVINAWRLPADRSAERLSLAYYDAVDELLIGYNGQDNQAWLARTRDGGTIDDRGPWLEPIIGGPALHSTKARLYFAYTDQSTQQVHSGHSGNPPLDTEEVGTYPGAYSIDTPGVVVTDKGPLIVYAGTDSPGYSLNAYLVDEPTGPPRICTFPDQCRGGPNLVTVGGRYAAAYVGHNQHLYLLFGVDALDPAQTERWKFADTSPWPPAVATINGETYVAWFGTDGENKLNFAHIDAMSMVYRGGSG